MARSTAGRDGKGYGRGNCTGDRKGNTRFVFGENSEGSSDIEQRATPPVPPSRCQQAPCTGLRACLSVTRHDTRHGQPVDFPGFALDFMSVEAPKEPRTGHRRRHGKGTAWCLWALCVCVRLVGCICPSQAPGMCPGMTHGTTPIGRPYRAGNGAGGYCPTRGTDGALTGRRRGRGKTWLSVRFCVGGYDTWAHSAPPKALEILGFAKKRGGVQKKRLRRWVGWAICFPTTATPSRQPAGPNRLPRIGWHRVPQGIE